MKNGTTITPIFFLSPVCSKVLVVENCEYLLADFPVESVQMSKRRALYHNFESSIFVQGTLTLMRVAIFGQNVSDMACLIFACKHARPKKFCLHPTVLSIPIPAQLYISRGAFSSQPSYLTRVALGSPAERAELGGGGEYYPGCQHANQRP